MVDLDFHRAAVGDHGLDVYHWTGHLSPAAPDARYAFPGGKELLAQEHTPVEESFALIAKTKPHLMMLVGYGGFIVIIWLMMFKPFQLAAFIFYK